VITTAIQAGGQSRRMGRDKALVQLDGQPLIAHLLACVNGLGDEILITTSQPGDYEQFGVRLVSDPVPGAGKLVGLHTALSAARGDHVLVLACDMPFVSRPLLEHMLGRAPEADIIVPHRNDRYEPLHAVYHRGNCLPPLRSALEAGKKRMISFFPEVKVLTIKPTEYHRFDPDEWSFFNVNTPEDLREAERRLQRLRGAS
jgi:molybdopterin-guanine dinucleotide biosynthesis protein A